MDLPQKVPAGSAGVETLDPQDRAPLLRRITTSLKAKVDALIVGFHEHGWTGRLYLLTCGLGIVSSLVATVALTVMSLTMTTFGLPFLLPAILFTGGTIWLQWLVLSGVARFRNWARRVAMVVSGAVLVNGIFMLSTTAYIPRNLILGLAQIALAIQFIVYFIRERDQFED